MLGQARGSGIVRLPGHPRNARKVDFCGAQTSRFIITVDTEEEFDWNAPFQRSGYGTGHIAYISRFQQMCEGFGIKPIYLIDYPIACDPDAIALFRQWIDADTCEIGAQLHPWVNPPHVEDVNVHNSYACNLPKELERQKLEMLFAQIEKAFGVKPVIYRAGRYGAGPETISVLEELGVKIDTSVRTLFDYSEHQGPDYMYSSLIPYWLIDNKVMELPLTTVFAGILRFGGRTFFSQIFPSPASRLLLSRLGLLERIALTPEGIPQEKAIEAIDISLDLGLPVLNLSFHSPSLAPGHTPYVRNDADLEKLYAWWQGVFAHLLARGVVPSSGHDLVADAF
jgi:hypothetical protein